MRLTNARGKAEFINLSAAEYQITASLQGFNTLKTIFVLHEGQNLQVPIVMELTTY
jgi:hypothetical protein